MTHRVIAQRAAQSRHRRQRGQRHVRAATLGIGGMAAAGATLFALAQQSGDPPGSEPQDCVNLMSIDHTEVVGDDTILFYMRGDEVFRNRLQSSCPDLRFDERFMYEVRTSQLCSVDVITVITDVGFGFRPGASCGLGEFEPISEELAAQLRDNAEASD